MKVSISSGYKEDELPVINVEGEEHDLPEDVAQAYLKIEKLLKKEDK